MKVRIDSFSNETPADLASVRKFTAYGRNFYRGQKQFIPLLDAEFLGSRILGMTGFFEKRNLFFKHGRIRFFLAYQDTEIVGRCLAFVNEAHENHWHDGAGFFGHFECIEDPEVAKALLDAAETWLRAQGKTRIRGPQNLPVNEATPGFMVEGFDSRPVVYYHYNPRYYAPMIQSLGYREVMGVRSWEVSFPDNPIEDALGPISKRIIEKTGLTFERWGERSQKIRKQEMFSLYNDAWNDNFGFVPFTEEEFNKVVDDMALIMDKELFIFAYIKGEVAGFFGGVPNIFESIALKNPDEKDLFRIPRLLFGKSKINGFRIGYLGVKKAFRRLGLDAVLIWKQNHLAKERGYHYSDMGWVLESNASTIKMIERCGAKPSKRYAIFEREL